MGFFDALFGDGQPEGRKQKKHSAPPAVEAQAGISPEVVAAITAAVYAIMGPAGTFRAVRITRRSNAWSAAGRQKLMDARYFG